MKNPLTSVRHALEARHADASAWSRLDVAALERSGSDHVEDEPAEMRRYLAAQTSQTV